MFFFFQAEDGIRDTSYQSMQIKVQKRFRSGGSILGAYTYSKFLGNIESGMGWLEYNIAGIQDNNYLKLEKAVSSFDTRHRLAPRYSVDRPLRAAPTCVSRRPRAGGT